MNFYEFLYNAYAINISYITNSVRRIFHTSIRISTSSQGCPVKPPRPPPPPRQSSHLGPRPHHHSSA